MITLEIDLYVCIFVSINTRRLSYVSFRTAVNTLYSEVNILTLNVRHRDYLLMENVNYTHYLIHCNLYKTVLYN